MMDLMSSIEISRLSRPITYRDRIMLVGSCFTEHIGQALSDSKFQLLQNPNGILFDPASVCSSLLSYREDRRYSARDFFQLNEVWYSWHHHSRFSDVDLDQAIQRVNQSQEAAHRWLKEANCLVITLGSSYSYRLIETTAADTGIRVANCHRAPAKWFKKELLSIGETSQLLSNCLGSLFSFNPQLQVILTISPVRHLRDGVVDNNRSKARLIESVHQMVEEFPQVNYFPAYELVVDILRDYRFYDIDLAHPNYLATEFVLEKFVDACIDPESVPLMNELKKLAIARRHRPMQPSTSAHRQFLKTHFEKAKALTERYPFLGLEEELSYFSRH